MQVIHVIPGHIERGVAQYDVVDDTQNGHFESPPTKTATLFQPEIRIPKHEPIKLGKLELKALATESSEYRRMTFVYKVLLPDGSIDQIAPGLLSNQVLARTGVLTCYRGRKCKRRLAFPCSTVSKGWRVDHGTQGLHYNAGIALCLWSYSEDIARCVAFQRQIEGSFQHRTFLRCDECLPCCSESVLRESNTILSNTVGETNIAHIF